MRLSKRFHANFMKLISFFSRQIELHELPHYQQIGNNFNLIKSQIKVNEVQL